MAAGHTPLGNRAGPIAALRLWPWAGRDVQARDGCLACAAHARGSRCAGAATLVPRAIEAFADRAELEAAAEAAGQQQEETR